MVTMISSCSLLQTMCVYCNDHTFYWTKLYCSMFFLVLRLFLGPCVCLLNTHYSSTFPLVTFSLHCKATLWRSKLNAERVEKGKGLFREKGTFFVNLKGLWENPFFSLLSVWAVSHRETPPTRAHTCLPDSCVCVCVHIVTYSMDQWTLTPHVRVIWMALQEMNEAMNCLQL